MSEQVARRQPPDLGVGQRAGRGEIVFGPVIDAGAAALKDRRQQQQRLALGGADDQLAAADAELRAAFGHLAHGVGRRRAAAGPRLISPGLISTESPASS